MQHNLRKNKERVQNKTLPGSVLQIVVNGDISDVKKYTECAHTHLRRLALRLGLGLAFSYIILQRTEAQITGKANTDLWGLCECVFDCMCAHTFSPSMLFLYNQSECPTRFSLWMQFRLGSGFIIQFDTQFQGCLYCWDLADVFVSELHAVIFSASLEE